MEIATVSVVTKFTVDQRTMSQPAAICRNKAQVELKAERAFLSRQRVLCRDIAKEEEKKIVTTPLTLSRQ